MPDTRESETDGLLRPAPGAFIAKFRQSRRAAFQRFWGTADTVGSTEPTNVIRGHSRRRIRRGMDQPSTRRAPGCRQAADSGEISPSIERRPAAASAQQDKHGMGSIPPGGISDAQ
jgi:hypothetical protein